MTRLRRSLERVSSNNTVHERPIRGCGNRGILNNVGLKGVLSKSKKELITPMGVTAGVDIEDDGDKTGVTARVDVEDDGDKTPNVLDGNGLGV